MSTPQTPTDLTTGPTRGVGEPGDRPAARARRERRRPARGQAADPHRRRRPERLPGGRARPAPPVRRGLPRRAGRVRARRPRGAARGRAARRPGGGAARRLPDAADERRRVPRAGHGPRPAGPPGAAHRVRRHRRGDRGDQRRRRRPLPAQAVGAAGGEALPGRRRACSTTWKREGDAPEHEIKILGHRWSAPSYEVRDFLARNGVPYQWYTVDEPEGPRLLGRGGAGPSDVPWS